jgi:mersacidin/lichenicidin family type 2 lantibiotic
MSNIDIVRAWKDEDYCSSLSDAERAELPDNPAGLVELSFADLKEVGGATIVCLMTLPICPSLMICQSMVTVCATITICLDSEA